MNIAFFACPPPTPRGRLVCMRDGDAPGREAHLVFIHVYKSQSIYSIEYTVKNNLILVLSSQLMGCRRHTVLVRSCFIYKDDFRAEPN